METRRSSRRIEVFILGLKTCFRGEKLLSELESRGFSTRVVWGIDGRKEHRNLKHIELKKSLFFQNREISQTEIACTLGHRIMHQQAANVKSDLYIFLEDDVAIDNFELFINSMEHISKYVDDLLIWNLLDRNHNILRSFKKREFDKYFVKTFLIPTSTTGYVMNYKTLTHLNDIYKSQESIGYLADYPVFFADTIGFMASKCKILKLNDDKSVVNSDRTQSQVSQKRTLLRNILIFTCISWIFEGRKYSSLKAYLMHFHARKIRHLRDNFHL